MFAAVSDPKVVYDLNTHIVRANSAFKAMIAAFAQHPGGATVDARAGEVTTSPRTAKKYRTNLMRKLGLRASADIILDAVQRGLINPVWSSATWQPSPSRSRVPPSSATAKDSKPSNYGRTAGSSRGRMAEAQPPQRAPPEEQTTDAPGGVSQGEAIRSLLG
jgi:hypothetical protein